METAVTVGGLLTFLGAAIGLVVLLAIAVAILSVIAKGFHH